MIKHLSKKVNRSSIKVFIDGLFYSKLTCNLPVFGNVFGLAQYKETSTRYVNYTKSYINELQVLQNKVNRILLNASNSISTAELCERSNSLAVQHLIAYSLLSTIYRPLESEIHQLEPRQTLRTLI